MASTNIRKAATQIVTDPAAPLSWRWSQFDALSPAELYAILQLRQMVFVVEQRCPYLDADGLDRGAWHLRGWRADPVEPGSDRLLAAYVRILPPGLKYPEPSIGRVATHPEVRGTGLGKLLMAEAIRRVESVAPDSAIRIGAQRYLERFYQEFGFRVASEPYDVDGIIHVEMLRPGGE
jgi:ElaA protein